ncbi:MAG TPA: Imm30 family immunity protein [Ruminiclostridium sp.]|nr:Imm30 family immunity protein [Ruminiclostridium sp.]
MNVDKEIQQLIDNRLLRDESEIQSYEDAIINIMKSDDIKTICKMCMGFDDNTEHHEVMYSLVHALEKYSTKFNDESSLVELANGIINMIPHAIKWAETLNKRVLNHGPSRANFAKIISTLQVDTRMVIIDLLKDLKNRKPDLFANKVDEVLNGVI